jgi:Uma2 family endonuclease
MAIQSRSLTFDDLERMRESSNDRLELIDGELFVTPSPTPLHQDISGNLYTLFRSVVFESGRGRVYFAPLDVRLAENTIVQSDLVVILIGSLGLDGSKSRGRSESGRRDHFTFDQ